MSRFGEADRMRRYRGDRPRRRGRDNDPPRKRPSRAGAWTFAGERLVEDLLTSLRVLSRVWPRTNRADLWIVRPAAVTVAGWQRSADIQTFDGLAGNVGDNLEVLIEV